MDIATKLFVYSVLPVNSYPRPFIGEIVRWTHIHNSGAAFGLFQGSRFFFITVSIISVLVILFVVRGRRYRSKISLIGFGMVLGGALGNLIDRIWLGVVIDFIDVGLGTLRWPVFNVADMGVSIGVIILGVGLLSEDMARARDESDGNPQEQPMGAAPTDWANQGDLDREGPKHDPRG
jgi:signal peptidase II